MNKNGKASYLGRFIVDFYTNSLRYVYKMVVTDSLKDSEEMIQILAEVVADLKQRVHKNLLGMILMVGETYTRFTKDSRLKDSLKQEEILESAVNTICKSQETEDILEEEKPKDMIAEVEITEELVRRVDAINLSE